MKSEFSVVLFFFVLAGCASSALPASKTDTYAWGEDIIEKLENIYPENFQDLLSIARIPENYDYSSRKFTYDKASNMEVNLASEDVVFLRNAGIISSIADRCKLDWAERNYLPIMQWQRKQVAESERMGYQIAIVGFIHGYAQGRADNWIAENDPQCEDATKILHQALFADVFD